MEGCGPCDSVKLKRTSFKSIEDKTKPPPGKVWVGDSIELRIPSAEKGFLHIMRYVCKGSGVKKSMGMLGLTASDCIMTEDQLRAEVRPDHGEILILRLDNLPGQKSKAVHDYHAGKQTDMEFSAPHCHEGASPAEVSFMHDVPKTLACQKQAPDLSGERHFYQAWKTVEMGCNSLGVLTTVDGVEMIRSPLMVYLGLSKPPRYLQLGFGAAVKAYISLETGRSKYEDHAYPGSYAGPHDDTKSDKYCAIWNGDKYIATALGNVTADEREVMARTQRDHPSHQPFGRGAEVRIEEITADCTTPFDNLTEKHPIQSKLDAEKMAVLALAEEAARLSALFKPVLWTPSAPWPDQPFTIGLLDGTPHEGDTGWFIEKLDPSLLHLRIDKVFGGYGHHIGTSRTVDGLLNLMSSPKYVGMAASVCCKPWSALHYEGAVQTVMFNADHKGGIPNADGTMPAKTQRVIDETNNVVRSPLRLHVVRWQAAHL